MAAILCENAERTGGEEGRTDQGALVAMTCTATVFVAGVGSAPVAEVPVMRTIHARVQVDPSAASAEASTVICGRRACDDVVLRCVGGP